MGVDYRLKIFRKVDNKLLGIVDANYLKSILDSPMSDYIHCRDRNCDKTTFEFNDLINLSEATFKKIGELYSEINEKKMMISLSKNRDVKESLEEDISYIKEDIKEYQYVIESTNVVKGLIDCVTESIYKDDKSAYQFNGEDLPKETHEYSNGDKYESSVYIWDENVYCEIEANW